MSGLLGVVVGGLIPPRSPTFRAVLAVHIPAGLAGVVAGAGAAVSRKRRGRHPRFGTVYFWALAIVFVTTIVLTVLRPEDAHLLVLGTLAFTAAAAGRAARRYRWRHWVPVHIIGMGSSYTLLLVAFYVDNAKNLPIWRNLPHEMYWALPTVVSVPLIARALMRYPDVFKRQADSGHV